MPLGPTVAFVPGTSPGQAPDADSAPEYLDVSSLLSARSADAFRSAPNFTALMDFFGETFQIGETVLQGVRQLCWVSTATGVQLDKKIEDLGGARNGRTDAQLRRVIPATWAALFRKRSLRLVYDILTLLTSGTSITFAYTNTGTASYMVTLITVTETTATEYHEIVILSKPEGVKYRTLVIEDPANVFTFDIGPGFDSAPMAYNIV